MLQRLRSFAGALFGRKRFEDVMSGEIRFHIDCYVDELVRSGVPVDEARRRARVEFGGVENMKEECREARRLNIVDGLRRIFEAFGEVRSSIRRSV